MILSDVIAVLLFLSFVVTFAIVLLQGGHFFKALGYGASLVITVYLVASMSWIAGDIISVLIRK